MIKKKCIRVGSRDSALAVAQAQLMIEQMRKVHPELVFSLVTMKTAGDKILDRRLDQIGGKGLFVKELDTALLDGRIDISVHSLKDLPMETVKELPLAAFSVRDDPRDAIILKPNGGEFRTEGITGTSSSRRILQLHRLFPQMKFQTIRGNLQTRFRKLEQECFDQIVLAAAGLRRMGMEQRIFRTFSIEEILPAAGQGILAVQAREGEDVSFLDCVNDRASAAAAAAERSFVRTLDGGCSSPIAAYAQVAGGEMKLKGMYVRNAGGEEIVRTGEIIGNVEKALTLGKELAERLKKEI